jgi:hypothetical protein
LGAVGGCVEFAASRVSISAEVVRGSQRVRRLAYEARITGETIEVRWPIRWDEAYGGA